MATTTQPSWTYRHCGDHIHITLIMPLIDGGVAQIVSPGLAMDSETVDIYLEFISAWTEVQIDGRHYVKPEDFPGTMVPTEEPLDFEEDE